ncbi:MAG: hypothetical protein OER86_00840 [Phycisphaerae bacterium]|nr:hypothetical protein [Phycisphaerae bacterium]
MRTMALAMTLIIGVSGAGLKAAGPTRGRAIRGLKFRDLNGQVIDFDADCKGNLVLWYFWSTAHKESAQGMKQIAQIVRKYGRQKFVVICLALEPQARDVAGALQGSGYLDKRFGKKWIQTANLSVRFNNAAPQKITDAFFLVKEADLPHVTLMNPSGAVAWNGQLDGLTEVVAKELGVPVEQIPSTAGDASALFDEAMESIRNDQSYGKAVQAFATLPDKVLMDPATLPQAAALILHLRQQAKENPKKMENLFASHPKAKAKIQKVVHAAVTMLRYEPAAPGKTDEPGRPTVDRRDAIARKRLAEADRLRESGDKARSYEIYRSIAENFGTTDAGATAADHVLAFEGDEKFMAAYRAQAVEREARALMNNARNYANLGRDDLARREYEKVLTKYPGSEAAKDATRALARLGN